MENTIQPSSAASTQLTDTKSKPLSLAKPSALSTGNVTRDIEEARSGVSEVMASTADEVRQAAESLKLSIQQIEPALKITIDDAIDIPVVTVFDESSNRVIRQIPNEDVVALARFIESHNFDDYNLKSDIRGVLLNDKS